MRGAFGKPQGTVARVHIGQPIMSVRCKDNHKAVAIEALRRAKFKFPGRQKVCLLLFHFVRYPFWMNLLCLPLQVHNVCVIADNLYFMDVLPAPC